MSSEILRPTGAGTFTQLTPTTGFANWDCVDEENPDNDTTRVASAYGGSEEFPVFQSHTDTYACSNPALRSGTIRSLDVTVVSKVSVVSGTLHTVQPTIYFNGTAYSISPSSFSSYYRAYTGRFRSRPDTGASWSFADIDSVEIGVKHAVQAYTSVTLATTQVYATLRVYSPWNETANGLHTFLYDADQAFMAYCTNPLFTQTGIGNVAKFLGQYEWECTVRDPFLYGKGKFPRVHVFTGQAETFLTETQSFHVRPTTRFSVWTLDTDPDVAASQNISICGAIASVLQQSERASVGGSTVTPSILITHYANWGNLDFRISGPRFLGDGYCLGTVDCTWEHVDP